MEAEDTWIAGYKSDDTIDVLAVIFVSLAVARSSPQSRAAVIKCDIRVNYIDRLLYISSFRNFQCFFKLNYKV